MSTVAVGGVGKRLHAWVSQRLMNWSLRLSPIPDGEDPATWKVSVVKVAARAGSWDDAFDCTHDVIRHLDPRTVHMILLLLVADVARPESTLTRGVDVWDWADWQEFFQMAATLEREGFDVG